MRRSLAGLVATTTALLLVAFLVPIALLLRSAAADRATSAATMEAQAIAQLIPSLRAESLPADGHLTVVLPDGRMLGAQTPRSPSIELAARGQSFVAATDGGREVLIGVQSSTGGAGVVRLLVPDDVLYDGVTATWAALASFGVALFCIGMLIAHQLGRQLVRSITMLAMTAERLGRGDRSARAELSGPPEVRAVAAELNRLAERIDELLSATRAETADLAHRLRTPLTALRLNVGGLHDAEESERLSENLDTLSMEVDELIRTARRPQRTGPVVEADLAAVASERLHFWSVLAEEGGRPMTGVIPERSVRVRIGAEDLAAVFDVLLDNALRHTPEGAAVRLVIDESGTAAVEDAGPGFGSDSPSGTSGATGLGLDIARRTIGAAGGTVRLETSALGGARVVLDLSHTP